MTLEEIRTKLHDLWYEAHGPIERAALALAHLEVTSDMAPATIRWLVPMLRDQARNVDCAGHNEQATGIRCAARELAEHLDG